jgi:hypothetical protein
MISADSSLNARRICRFCTITAEASGANKKLEA